ncbi:hypothetical protein OIU84_027834 [Salix udensis]|uniref:Cysteine protease n=1 Tax=Salix udensis TaxID=889485 RepID=A0AAD6KDL7_9ROSI|nr:hypothetical protein OIU84_027834 [Salix udensis]
MLRSSQMLVAQPLDREYVEILHLFGDSESSTFSIHNLLRAGKAYGLAAGSWVGPYAVCHSWESPVHSKREETNLEYQSFQWLFILFYWFLWFLGLLNKPKVFDRVLHLLSY